MKRGSARWSFAILLSLIALCACSERGQEGDGLGQGGKLPSPAPQATRAEDQASGEAADLSAPPQMALGLGEAEMLWLKERASASGSLRAAIREREDTYERLPDGSIRGFDYELLKGLASSLGLRLELSVQSRIDAFFAREGTVPKDLGSEGSAYDYTPDLLKSVDLYAGPFAVVPWRQRLMTMIPVFPTRNQLASLKGKELDSIRSLDGARFAVLQGSIQQKSLEELARREGIRLSFVFGETETSLFGLVEEGRADYILDGSVYFAKKSLRLERFSLSPFPEDILSTGWCVKKEDTLLAAIIGKYLKACQDSGFFAAIWTQAFGQDFEAYLEAVLATAPTGRL